MSQADKLEERTAELIQGGLDNELSAAEQAELDTLLNESTAAQAQHAGLASLVGLLDTVPQEEPPEYLKNVILTNVTVPVTPAASEQKGLFGRWSDSFSMRSGFALALVAVLIAGIYQMGAGPFSSGDTEQMVGTVVQSPAPQPELNDQVNWPPTEDIEINTDRLNGVVQIHRLEKGLALDFSLDSDAPYELRVDLSDTALRYSGLEVAGLDGAQNYNDLVSDTVNEVTISSPGKLSGTLNLGQESPLLTSPPMSLVVALWVEGESLPVTSIKWAYNGDSRGFDEEIKPE